MKEINKETIIRTIVLVFALINQGLTIAGKNPLPFTEEEIGTAITYIITVIATIWTWWKNNSFTKEAVEADNLLKELKGEK